jgi:hypothetical protein
MGIDNSKKSSNSCYIKRTNLVKEKTANPKAVFLERE